jgi:hypothetical protein
MTMDKVAKKNREQGQRKRDARVRHHGSDYKGPQGGLSTHAMPQEGEPFSQTVHAPFNHDDGTM